VAICLGKDSIESSYSLIYQKKYNVDDTFWNDLLIKIIHEICATIVTFMQMIPEVKFMPN